MDKGKQAHKATKNWEEFLKGSCLHPMNCHLNIEADFEYGSDFIPIEGLVEVNSGEKINIQKHEGEVLVIDFWPDVCKCCSEYLQRYEDMIDENFHWGSQVRIIAIALNLDSAKVLARLREKNWGRNVEHYLIGDSTAHIDYCYTRDPFTVVIDTANKVQAVGNLQMIKIEKLINILVEGKDLKKCGIDLKAIQNKQK